MIASDRDTRINRIVKYNMFCGQKEDKAREYAEQQLAKGEDISILGKFKDDYGGEEEFLIGNFVCQAEVYSWVKFEEKDFVRELVNNAFNEGRIDTERCFGRVEYAKNLAAQRCYSRVILQSKDPFFYSILGEIDMDLANQCCEPVRLRILDKGY